MYGDEARRRQREGIGEKRTPFQKAIRRITNRGSCRITNITSAQMLGA
jgi:hypothetical protein